MLKTVDVPVLADTVDEPAERLLVKIVHTTNVTLGDGSGTVSINPG